MAAEIREAKKRRRQQLKYERQRASLPAESLPEPPPCGLKRGSQAKPVSGQVRARSAHESDETRKAGIRGHPEADRAPRNTLHLLALDRLQGTRKKPPERPSDDALWRRSGKLGRTSIAACGSGAQRRPTGRLILYYYKHLPQPKSHMPSQKKRSHFNSRSSGSRSSCIFGRSPGQWQWRSMNRASCGIVFFTTGAFAMRFRSSRVYVFSRCTQVERFWVKSCRMGSTFTP